MRIRAVDLVAACFLIAGCQSISQTTPALETKITATSTKPDTPTATPTPTPEPLELPINWGEPFPLLTLPIGAGNVGQLVHVGHYLGNAPSVTRQTEDSRLTFVRDYGGLSVFETGQKVPLLQVSLPENYNTYYDLQISQNGDWALINQSILVDLRHEEAVVRDLGEEFNLIWPEAWLTGEKPLVVIGTNSSFYIFDLSTDEQIYNWSGSFTAPHGLSPQFSPSGKLLAARVDYQLKIWDVSTQKLVLAIPLISSNVRGWRFSPSERLFGVVDNDTLFIWDLTTGEKVQTIPQNCRYTGRWRGPELRPVFSENDKYVATAQLSAELDQCPVDAWKVSDGAPITHQEEWTNGRELQIGPEGQLLFVDNPKVYAPWPNDIFFIGYNEKLQISVDLYQSLNCEVANFETYNCLPRSGVATDRFRDNLYGFYGATGRFYTFMLSNSQIKIYDGLSNSSPVIYTRDYFDTSNTEFIPMALDPVHKLLYYAIRAGGDTRNMHSFIINYETDQVLFDYDNFGGNWGLGIFYIAFFDNARLHAYCVAENGNTASLGKFQLYDAEKNEIIYTKNMIYCPTMQPAFSSDGSLVITTNRTKSGFDGPTQLLTIRLGEQSESNLHDYDCNISAIALSKDDTVLAVACEDLTIRFLVVDTLEEVYRLHIGTRARGIAFSPDGTNLTVVSQASIDVWGIYAAGD